MRLVEAPTTAAATPVALPASAVEGADRARARLLLAVGAVFVLALALPCAAYAHLERRLDRDLSPRLSSFVGTPVTLGGLDISLIDLVGGLGVLRIDDIDVGGMVSTAAVTVVVDPSQAQPVRVIEIDQPAVQVRVDRVGQTDIETVLNRLRRRLAKRRARIADRRPDAHRAATPAALPHVRVSGGALRVAIARCGQATIYGIDIAPHERGVRAVLGDTEVDLDCGPWRIDGTLGRAAADISLPGLTLDRLLAVGGRLDIRTGGQSDDPRAASTADVTLTDLTLTRGVDQRAGTSLRGRVASIASRPHFAASVQRRADHLSVVLSGDELPLAPFRPLLPKSITLARATGSGELTLALGPAVTVTVDAALSGVIIDDRRVAQLPVETDVRVEAALTMPARGAATPAGSIDDPAPLASATTLHLERARFTLGALRIDAHGDVHYDHGDSWLPARGSVRVAIPPVDCAAALAAIPRGLRPHLAGLDVDGRFEGTLGLDFDVDNLAATTLDIDLGIAGCQVRREATSGDPKRLRGTFSHRFSDGSERRVGPDGPGYVALDSLPEYVPQAFVSAEDARFFDHHGFDVYQIARSLAVDLRDRAFVRGGSTISQQTVKNLFLSHRRTLARKLQEAVLTWRLEAHLSKAEILERYLNVIELGPGVFGLEAAARYWFGKPARALELREAAFLAALTPAPQSTSRRLLANGGVDATMRARVDGVLALLRRERKISERASRHALSATLELAATATPAP